MDKNAERDSGFNHVSLITLGIHVNRGETRSRSLQNNLAQLHEGRGFFRFESHLASILQLRNNDDSMKC